ncbi:MAG: hypothetical protein H6698_08665 [Myxococcales bacterium]|nr:hypothetical protein [Myxococcales bacterium]MCB9520004.1 hypothetical protein [Myxococcales bacterium]MCB9534363.1 hypothetical protein [Myxococcales bacterium]
MRSRLRAAAFLALTTLAVIPAGCITIVEEPGTADAGTAAPDVDVTAAACGELTTDDFTCGGDPVGSWVIVGACAVPAAYDPLEGTCPEIATTAGPEAAVSGTLELRGDGSYTLRLERQSGSLDFSFPLSCYGGSELPCRGDNFGGECEVDRDECVCAVSISRGEYVETGDWTRFYETMTMYPVGLGPAATAVCRADRNTLRWVRFPSDVRDPAWALTLVAAP